MKCIVCKQAETRPGSATVTLERDGLTVVFKGVHYEMKIDCGEFTMLVQSSHGISRHSVRAPGRRVVRLALALLVRDERCW